MRNLALAVMMLLSSLAFAIPAMEARSEQGVSLMVPTGWKMLVTPGERSINVSRDAFTQVILRWYPYRDGVDKNALLDKLVSVMNTSLKVGSVAEKGRRDILGGRGRIAEGVWSGPLGYTLGMGFVVVVDPSTQRILSGVFFSSPEEFSALGGNGLLEQIAGGVTTLP